jgi:GNAT superfamily N-acetyltransferase
MTTPNIEIRQATPADLPTIVDLNYALFQEDAGQRDPSLNLEWARQHGHEYFAKLIAGANSVCFVAEVGSDVAGYLVGYTKEPSDIRPLKTAELESMFVREAARSQGVGARLISDFVDWARGRGAQSVSVTAYYANQRAIAFYQRAGFTPLHLSLKLDTQHGDEAPGRD